MNSILGDVVTVDEVCQHVATTLQDNLPAVLASIADPDGRELEPPVSYEQVPTREAVIAAAVPAIGIFSPGAAGAPHRDEDGNWMKTWRITVAIYVRADSYTNTQWACRTYGALVQALLVQNQTLGGIANGLTPTGEAYDVIDPTAARTLAGAAVDFDVEVPAAFSDMPVPPYTTPDTTVQTVGVDIHPALT